MVISFRRSDIFLKGGDSTDVIEMIGPFPFRARMLHLLSTGKPGRGPSVPTSESTGSGGTERSSSSLRLPNSNSSSMTGGSSAVQQFDLQKPGDGNPSLYEDPPSPSKSEDHTQHIAAPSFENHNSSPSRSPPPSSSPVPLPSAIHMGPSSGVPCAAGMEKAAIGAELASSTRPSVHVREEAPAEGRHKRRSLSAPSRPALLRTILYYLKEKDEKGLPGFMLPGGRLAITDSVWTSWIDATWVDAIIEEMISARWRRCRNWSDLQFLCVCPSDEMINQKLI